VHDPAWRLGTLPYQSHTDIRTSITDVTLTITISFSAEPLFLESLTMPWVVTLQVTPLGLTSPEAQRRLDLHGPNRLPDKGRNLVLVYLG
jgi:hypothetical protein